LNGQRLTDIVADVVAEWGEAKARVFLEAARAIAQAEKEGKHDLTVVLHKGTLCEVFTTVRRRSA
jgi:hypothetical protein